MFPRPRGAGERGGGLRFWPLCWPHAPHTCGRLVPTQTVKGEGWRWRWSGGSTNGDGFNQKLVSKLTSVTSCLWTERVCCPVPLNSHLPSDSLFITLTLSLYKGLEDEATELNVCVMF